MSDTTATGRRAGDGAIAAFLVVTFGWSWGFWAPKALAAAGLIEGVPVLPELGAFGPTVAAFVLVTYSNGVDGARRLASRAVRVDFPTRWLLPTLFLSPAVVFASLAVAAATGTVPSFPRAGTPVVLPIAFAFVLVLLPHLLPRIRVLDHAPLGSRHLGVQRH